MHTKLEWLINVGVAVDLLERARHNGEAGMLSIAGCVAMGYTILALEHWRDYRAKLGKKAWKLWS